MTTVIDERVVEMRFNNEDFEKNVAQSMGTLEKLKHSLDFDSAKSLENLGKAAKGIDLSGMTQTITEATTKFSALEIAGITALANITNKAVDFGISFAKSLSIDQVTSGFDKYAVKTQSVQTIMAATADQFENQAEQMKYVNEQLDKLTWFTDETSYSMTDMTSNIGKFVSNNIALEEAVTAMEGIATWAGLSGAGVTEASRAMYNFSQAMGAGAMKLQDWKSIENANMATAKFKETAIETAVELGKLQKSADGLVTTLNGKTEVSVTSFSESLKQKWFDTEVMTATLGKFGKFADELYNLSDATNLTASELLEALDEYKAGTLDISEIAADSSMSIEDLNEKFKELSGEGFELGKKAFAASQEAKTFKEAIDSVKDAVSSGWMNTFEIIFGNYLEAKKLWTGLANNLYDMFAEGGNKRNEVLAVWKELGGRNSLIMGAVNALNLLIKPFQAIKEAFESILPKGRDFGRILNQLSYKFYIFTSRLQPSQELLNNIYQFFRGIFSVGKLVLQFITSLVNAIVKLVSPAKSLIEIVGSFLGKVGIALQVITAFVSETGLIQTAVSFIVLGIQKLAGVIKTIAVIFAGGILTGLRLFISLIQKATTIVSRFVSIAGMKLAWVGNKISTVFSKVAGIFDKFSKTQKKNSDITLKMGRAYDSTGKLIGNLGRQVEDAEFTTAKEMTLLDRFIEAITKAKNVLVTFATVVGGGIVALGVKIFKFFTDFKQRFQDVTANASTWMDYIKGFFETIGSLFADGWEKAKAFFAEFGIDLSTLETAFATIKDGLTTIIDKLGPGRIAALGFATALLGLVGAAIKLSDSFRSMFGAISGVFNNINKILKKQFAKSSVVTDLAKAFAIIAGSLTVLAMVDATYHDNLVNVSNIMFKLMIAFTACAAALRGLDLLLSKFDIDTDFNLINSNIMALAASMTLLSAAFAILNFVELKDDWLKKLGIMAVLFAEITIAAAVLSKIAPSLSKGSFLLLSLALSMKLMVDALSQIGEKDIDGVNKNLAGFTVLFIGVAALTAAAGKIKLTSAVSLILVAKALQTLMPQIQQMLKDVAPIISDMCNRLEGITIDFAKAKEFAKKMFEKANEFFNYLYANFSETTATTLSLATMILGTITGIMSLAAIVGVGVALAKIITAIGSLGNVLKGAGIAIIGLAIGVRIITEAIKDLGNYFQYLTDKQYNRVMDGFLTIVAVMTGMIGVLTVIDAIATVISKNGIFDGKTVRTSFMGMAAAFVGIGLAMKLIVSSLKGLEGLDETKFWSLIQAMGILLVCLAAAAAGAGQITKGVPALIGLIGVATTMAILIAELGVLSVMWSPENERGMFLALASITGLILGLVLALNSLSRVKTGPILAIILPITGMITILAGILTVLGSLKEVNYWAMAAAVIGITLILAEVVGLFIYIAHMPAVGVGLGNKIKLLVACIAALGSVAFVLAGVATAAHFLGWSMLNGLVVLTGGMALLGVVFTHVAKMSALGRGLENKLKLLKASVIALAGVAVILGALSFAVKGAGWENSLSAMVNLALMLGALAAVMKVISDMKEMTDDETLSKIALLAACALALLPLSHAMVELSKEEANDNWNSLFVLAAGMGGLTAVLWAVTKITSTIDVKGIIGSVALLISACGVIWSLAGAIAMLSGIDTAQLDAASKAMQDFAIALGVMLGVLGVIDAVVASVVGGLTGGQGGAAGALALPGLFLSIAVAAVAMGWGFKQASEGVKNIADAFTNLADALKTMNGLNLSTIASGMYEMAGAGIALGAAAGSVAAFATSMDSLASALSHFNSAKYGGSGGGGGVTFEPITGANTVLQKSCEDTAVVVEEFSRQNVENYGNMVTEITEGTLENIPKAEEATKDLMTRPWKELNQVEKEARNAGYHTIEAYFDAINNGVEKAPDLSKPKGILETFAKDTVETVKENTSSSVTEGLKELGGNITSFFTNGELASALGGAGTMLGKLFGGNMAYAAMQMISQLKGSFDWMFNLDTKIMGKAINQYGANGMPSDVINKMYGGNTYSKAVQSLLNPFKAAKKEFDGWASGDFLGGVNTALGEAKELFEGAGEAAEGFGDAASGGAGKAGKALEGLRDTLKDTIGNQLDMFSKFEIKMGVTGEQMIENMKSNIDGFASWSHRMTVLAERFAEHGISDTLYKQLAELGPKGYETMNAFYQMTDEQLEEVRGLWETGLTLPEGQADIVASGFTYMGEMSVQGFSNALDDHKAAHEAAHGLGKAALDGLSEALEVHSPSKATEQIGQYLIEGLARGIDSVYGQGILYFAVKHVSEHVLELFNENLSPEIMGEAGSGILTNLFTGLLGETIEANPIFTAFLETFTNFEVIDEALTLFVEHIKELLYEQFEIGGDEEPSEWFYRYAMSWLQAIINSFIENEVLVRAQIIIFCMHIIETFGEQDLPGFAYDVGMNIALGLKQGIEDYAEEAITAARDMVDEVMEIMAEVPQVESPSKVTRSIGGYISQGLALGIEDGASNVYNAAKTVAEGGIDGMQGEMGRLQDLMTNGLDFNPIITPMLDLSYIKQQMSELDYLMNDPEYGIGQNGGDMATGKTQQINFTQNNYSPKSLTRYEIYRQTQNQLSQLKGALG